MGKRIKLFALVILLLLPIIASCNIDGGDQKEKLFSAYINKVELSITSLNEDGSRDDVLSYNRDYKNKNGYFIVVNEEHKDRTILVIEQKNEYGEFVTRLTSVFSSEDKDEKIIIPVNGLVLSIKNDSLDKDNLEKLINTKLGSRIKLVDYKPFPYEDLSRAVVNIQNNSRKLNFRNPKETIKSESIVYIDSNADSYTIPEDAYAVEITKGTLSKYTISNTVTGSTVKGNEYIIFFGEYNVDYAKQLFIKEEQITMSNLKMVLSDTDKPYIKINNKTYELGGADNNNPTISNNGVYLYNTDYKYAATPRTKLDFVEVVVDNDKIVWIGKKNQKQIVPRNSGYLISFVGDMAKETEDFNIGANVETMLIEKTVNSAGFIRIGASKITTSGYGIGRTNDNIVVYGSDYGTKTPKNDNGIEIVVVDGVITAIDDKNEGTKIPHNGNVIAIGGSNERYNYLAKLEVGDEIFISPVNWEYKTIEFEITSFNTSREENFIVVYDGEDGKDTTNTNQWGLELIVDNDFRLVELNAAGNSEIPKGGYVVSVHGQQNTSNLQSAFTFGASAYLDKENKKFTIIETPALKIETLDELYAVERNRYNSAKENLVDVNYNFLNDFMTTTQEQIDLVKSLMVEYNFDDALRIADSAYQKIDNMKYILTESFVIENRVVWYRPVEKTEVEVEQTVKRAKELNLTAIYIETWYDGYTIFDKIESEYVHKNPRYGDLDVLDAFIKYGKLYGVEIHAWVETFFAGVERVSNPKLNNLLELRLLSKSGLNYYPVENDKYLFLNPYDKRSQDIVYGIYDALISNYDIDGLNHDYIRFPEPVGDDDYGYNDDIIAGFQAKYDTSKNPRNFVRGTKDWNDWCQFREDIVSEFVYRIDDMINKYEKDIIVSCALFPNVAETRVTIFQNAKAWVDAGLIDEAFTMSYFLDVPSVEANASTVSNIIKDNAFFSVGIASFIDVETATFAEQITAIRKYSGTGVAIFSLNALLGSKYSEPLMLGQFRRESVSSYEYEKLIPVGVTDIVRKIDELYLTLKPESKDELNLLKTELETLIEAAKKADIENQDSNYKISLLKDWESILKELKLDIKSNTAFDEKLRNALEKDIELIRIYLARSEKRLSSKLK